MMRNLGPFLLLAACFGRAAWGQYTGLATPYDGSAVYFASTLRLEGTTEPDYGKLFVADETGVRLFRSRQKVDPTPPGYTGGCFAGPLYDFTWAETSADGRTIAGQGLQSTTGGCRAFWATDLISPAGERDVAGQARMSPAGRWAITLVISGTLFGTNLEFLDLQSGTQAPVPPPSVSGAPLFFLYPGRAIADDGTAIFSSYAGRTYTARPGGPVLPFPAAGTAVAIDASGSKVLYVANGDLRILELRSAGRAARRLGSVTGTLVLSGVSDVTAFSMSDDARRILLLRGGQAWVVQSDGSGLRAITSEPAGIASAILSGNGAVVYAATGAGRILKIEVDKGRQVEIIGRTPYVATDSGVVRAGLFATVNASGLTDVPLQANPPLGTSLGNVTVRIGGRAVPISQITPTAVSFLVPWDILPAQTGGTLPVIVEAPGSHSPFAFPQSTIHIDAAPAAGVIAHQNWDGYVNAGSPPHVGEIIHVVAVGLGPVNPEVPVGSVSPSTEPLARLAAPMTCSNAEVLYAGLAPGSLERVYQVDMRFNVAGYRQFTCSVPGLGSFLFLTLNVLP
jgi:uncharacterized protein (TIGR03437 family)